VQRQKNRRYIIKLKLNQQNYVAEDRRLQLDQANNKIEERNTQIKTLEKYKQLESKTGVSPSNSIPAPQ
jgi:hypothetical protein